MRVCVCACACMYMCMRACVFVYRLMGYNNFCDYIQEYCPEHTTFQYFDKAIKFQELKIVHILQQPIAHVLDSRKYTF